MRWLRGIVARLFRRRPATRTVAGSAHIELYHGKEPITGRIDYTETEITPED